MKVSTGVISLKTRRREPAPVVLQKRQREINQRLVTWMAGGKSLAGTLTVDACAGPEGSLWAVNNLKGRWIGNEISNADYAILEDNVLNLHTQKARTIKNDAHRLALDKESVDYFLFVLALNHLRVNDAIKEASRTLKGDGRLVIADSGPTFWIMDLVIYCALEKNSFGAPRRRQTEAARQLLGSRRRLCSNVGIFCGEVLGKAEIDLAEYSRYLLKNNFGRPVWDDYCEEIGRSLRAKQFDRQIWWRDQRRRLDAFYWDNLLASLAGNGFSLSRLGIMPSFEIGDKKTEKRWEVGTIIDCEIDRQNLYQTGAGKVISGQSAQKKVAGQTEKRMSVRCLMARKIKP